MIVFRLNAVLSTSLVPKMIMSKSDIPLIMLFRKNTRALIVIHVGLIYEANNVNV
jgi:hypothetical protein